MTDSGVEGSGEAAVVLKTPRLESAKPGFIDRVIYAEYISSGANQLVTFEKVAQKLGDVLVLSR